MAERDLEERREGLVRVERTQPAPEPDPRSYADVGAGVAGILEAAEAAADKIRADARKEASDLIREAEEAVAARLQALTREAEGTRVAAEEEARDVRLAVEAYATQRRREADEEFRRALDEAGRDAAQLRDAAEEAAKRANAETTTRAEELRAEVKRLEARREKIVAALRRISSHIDDLVADEPAVERQPEPESLPEALTPDRRSLRRRR
jgi:hypothetical protein